MSCRQACSERPASYRAGSALWAVPCLIAEKDRSGALRLRNAFSLTPCLLRRGALRSARNRLDYPPKNVKKIYIRHFSGFAVRVEAFRLLYSVGFPIHLIISVTSCCPTRSSPRSFPASGKVQLCFAGGSGLRAAAGTSPEGRSPLQPLSLPSRFPLLLLP